MTAGRIRPTTSYLFSHPRRRANKETRSFGTSRADSTREMVRDSASR
jgi:hypothetical protein